VEYQEMYIVQYAGNGNESHRREDESSIPSHQVPPYPDTLPSWYHICDRLLTINC
jgi:hypothetical protein